MSLSSFQRRRRELAKQEEVKQDVKGKAKQNDTKGQKTQKKQAKKEK